MTYKRHDKDCNVAAVQPISEKRIDAYGNSYEDFCGDYVSRDVENQIITTSTFSCVGYKSHTWIPRYVDNTVRPLSSYVPSPLVIDETDIFIDIRFNGGIFKLVDEKFGRTIIPDSMVTDESDMSLDIKNNNVTFKLVDEMQGRTITVSP